MIIRPIGLFVMRIISKSLIFVQNLIWKSTITLQEAKKKAIGSIIAAAEQISGSVTIYPNPANDEVFIYFIKPFIGDLFLADVLGRQVYHNRIAAMKEYRTRINLQSLPAGVYFIKIKPEQGTSFEKKIVKI